MHARGGRGHPDARRSRLEPVIRAEVADFELAGAVVRVHVERESGDGRVASPVLLHPPCTHYQHLRTRMNV
jgi:hypothetical protein